jgi:DNA-directed RNA polymerase specialized sigma24 family protein
LLATHSHRLGREELEDCYSQATLEMLMRACRPAGSDASRPFAGNEHIANALDQRLRSRIQDRHRALGGRSPIEAVIAWSVPLIPGDDRGVGRELVDERTDVVRTALVREELRRIARFSRELTRDQRLHLSSQIGGEQTPGEFCAQHGWSLEKYRKVGQRARARLTQLLMADSIACGQPAACDQPVVPAGAGGRINTQGPAYVIHSPTT